MLDDTSDDVAGAGLSASCCFQKLLRVIHGRTRFNCCHNAASREPTHMQHATAKVAQRTLNTPSAMRKMTTKFVTNKAKL